MAWARDAQRLAEDGYMVVVFLDELTTVPPTTQAAMLRLLTENVCGELKLPDYAPGKGGVVYLCASNAVEWAAGGQEIQAPMANRLWHGEFPIDHDTWCDMMVSDFPAPASLPVLPTDYLHKHHHGQRAMIAAYVKAVGRDAWMAPPDDPARRSGPWPSGRTWYLASRLLAAIEAVSPGNRLLQGPALAGLVGDQALPFLEYHETLNLPDPEDILKDPRSFVLPDRVDRAYARTAADSRRAWMGLVVWEFWMGLLLYGALRFGTYLIVTAPDRVVTVFDFTNCYAAPPVVLPCERIAYRAGARNVLFNGWCGLLLVFVGAWLMWRLWSAAAPKPITDDFLKLLDDSFGRDWRSPRTWPWTRMAWAYGFTVAGAASALCIGLLVSAAIPSSARAKAPTVHVDTSQSFRVIP